MIDHEHKIIYIHINRCAGTSIERFFNCKGDHKTVSNYIHKMKMKKFKEYYSFAFVRNPWDKMLSMYQHNVEGSPNTNRGKSVRMEFNEWLTILPNAGLWNRLRWSNQYDWLTHRNKIQVNFIGRFERLNADWKLLLEKIGLPHSHLCHHNSSKRRKKDYRSYYNDDGRQAVDKYFAKDIKEFGYEF